MTYIVEILLVVLVFVQLIKSEIEMRERVEQNKRKKEKKKWVSVVWIISVTVEKWNNNNIKAQEKQTSFSYRLPLMFFAGTWYATVLSSSEKKK